MKAWMETRWRLLALVIYLLIALALDHRNLAGSGVLTATWFMLTVLAILLGGSGVNSQGPLGAAEGVAGSTQFTISLPVTRLRLFGIRVLAGLAETAGVTVVTALFLWAFFPAVRELGAPADFWRLVLTTALFLIAPYCAHVFFSTWCDEPFSIAYAGFLLILLLLFCHRLSPGMDILRAFGQASPLETHRLPWTQLAASLTVALSLACAALLVIRRREY